MVLRMATETPATLWVAAFCCCRRARCSVFLFLNSQCQTGATPSHLGCHHPTETYQIGAQNTTGLPCATPLFGDSQLSTWGGFSQNRAKIGFVGDKVFILVQRKGWQLPKWEAVINLPQPHVSASMQLTEAGM